VDRARPRRAMRPTFALWLARLVVPAALLSALGVGVANAVTPGDDAQVACTAPASIASVDSTLSASDTRGREVGRHIARAPIPSLVAPKAKSSASETITPAQGLNAIDSEYAATDLNVMTDPKYDSAALSVVRAGRSSESPSPSPMDSGKCPCTTRFAG
jgi:hypothetical protein